MTKKNSPNSINSTIQTRDFYQLLNETRSIYESIAVMAKRANQIGVREKEELHAKLKEFESTTDNLEEIFENREQIEISRYYEKQPKPTLVSLQEFKDGEVYFRHPDKDKNDKQ